MATEQRGNGGQAGEGEESGGERPSGEGGGRQEGVGGQRCGEWRGLGGTAGAAGCGGGSCEKRVGQEDRGSEMVGGWWRGGGGVEKQGERMGRAGADGGGDAPRRRQRGRGGGRPSASARVSGMQWGACVGCTTLGASGAGGRQHPPFARPPPPLATVLTNAGGSALTPSMHNYSTILGGSECNSADAKHRCLNSPDSPEVGGRGRGAASPPSTHPPLTPLQRAMPARGPEHTAGGVRPFPRDFKGARPRGEAGASSHLCGLPPPPPLHAAAAALRCWAEPLPRACAALGGPSDGVKAHPPCPALFPFRPSPPPPCPLPCAPPSSPSAEVDLGAPPLVTSAPVESPEISPHKDDKRRGVAPPAGHPGCCSRRAMG